MSTARDRADGAVPIVLVASGFGASLRRIGLDYVGCLVYMLPSGTALEHPFGVHDFDVGVSGGSLYFGCLSIGVGDYVGCSPGNVRGNFCAKASDP